MYNNTKKTNHLCLTLILLGLIYSIFTSLHNTEKYDKFFTNNIGKEEHHIIRTDIYAYWNFASKYKKNIESGKPILESGNELTRSYLYPKLIGLYYLLIDDDIFDKNGKLKLKNSKLAIPLIQSIFFYLCLFFFYKKISSKFSSNIIVFNILFLSLEPNILQYHSSYWTESLYLSFLLIFFSFFIDNNKKYYHYLLFGVFIGLMFMQRNVSIFLFIPAIIYLFINLKFKAIKPSIFLIAGYSLVILFIGYENFRQTKVFYVVPKHQLTSQWHYLGQKLIANKLNISEAEGSKIKLNDFNQWKEKNNIDLENFEDKRKVYKYKSKYTVELLKENIFFFAKYHIYKSMQSLILSVDEVYREYNNDKTVERYWELPSFKKNLKYKIFYSFIIYIICFIGLIRILLKGNLYEKKLSLFIIMMCLYFTTLLGWVGTGRYMVTNEIFYSIFFGYGLNFLYTETKKKLIKNKKI